MKLQLSCGLALAALAALAAGPSPAAGDEARAFRWRTDLDAARKDALAEGRPLLAVFR
ncbi:MAG: hypothetical protein HY721_12480 [Planctomycetes bacterium]|nr:hypothetical protein [Planctomycetota bacterium]